MWAFVAEPHYLADWWPGLAAVRPDRRGFARGARWQIVRAGDGSLLRRPSSSGTIVVTTAEPLRLFAFELVEERLRAELVLAPGTGARTSAQLAVEAPLLVGPRRSLPRQALRRLYDLCQTAADE